MVRVCASFLGTLSPFTHPFTLHRSARVSVLAGGTLLVLEPINLVLAEMKADGTLDTIYAKWFLAE
jgi:hypothetical protein